MSHYTTLVFRTPKDPEGRARIAEAMRLLEPYQTGMSLEDEMTVLEFIEQHDDFASYIADDARLETKKLHATVNRL